MLAIRLQRTGRKGYAQYRVIVQDAHRSPTSGRVVAYVGNYDPHAKTVALKKDKVEFYLEHGAQPSERVAGLLKSEGLKLPKWVNVSDPKERTTRNPEKLRKNQPAKPAEEAKEEAPTEAVAEDTAPAEDAKPTEESKEETVTDEASATEEAKPAEEPKEEPAAEVEKAEEKPAKDK